MKDKKRIKAIIGFAVIVLLFIFMSFLFELYGNEILRFVVENSFSMILYVIVTIFAIVIAPVSTLPLIPLASHLWGWVITGMLSIVGWTIGAQIAFLLARRFGEPFVARIFPFKKLHTFENYFTDKNLFWTVVFLRMMIPVDILSYALGLFSKIRSVPFFFSTLIGVTPFAFIFSYIGNMSSRLQIVIFMEAIAVFAVVYIVYKVTQKRKM